MTADTVDRTRNDGGDAAPEEGVRKLQAAYWTKRLDHTLDHTRTASQLVYAVDGAVLAFIYFALDKFKDFAWPFLWIALPTLAIMNFSHAMLIRRQQWWYRRIDESLMKCVDATPIAESGGGLLFSSHGIHQFIHHVVGVALVLAAMVAFMAKSPIVQRAGSDSWAYRLHFGDSRARAHEALGNATRTTEQFEEYPMSGVTLWFSPEGQVTKFNFHGSAGALYSGPSSMVGQSWIPSDRSLVFGLTAYANEVDFAKLLGTPIIENVSGSANTREVRRIWRKDGCVIDALFLASDRTDSGKIFPKGSLVWFEISPGL